ncbi:MAG: hypothetical protein HYY44_02515, partial [Deltaproteobacteria bacterium]|nr:hypothetical protein [Deltaproteobacteria bacterium]
MKGWLRFFLLASLTLSFSFISSFQVGAAPAGFVYREGSDLLLDGGRYTFTGANRYGLANSPDYHCGWDGTDFDAYLDRV